MAEIDFNSLNNKFNQSAYNGIINKIDRNVKDFTTPLNETLRGYTEELDNIMLEIRNLITGDSIETPIIEKYLLKLTSHLYFMGTKLDELSSYVDMSSTYRDEVYNTSYLDNRVKDFEKKNKYTVAELQSIAEESSKYESVLSALYKRAYSVLNYKISAAETMVKTLSKVLSKRMQEEDTLAVGASHNRMLME